jgi:hypothetical protein
MLLVIPIYLLFAYIVFFASKSTTDGWWAFFFFDELPGWVRIASVGAPLGLLLALKLAPVDAIKKRLPRKSSKVRRTLLLSMMGLLAALIFWTFREHRLWGDGPTLVGVVDGRIGKGAIAEIFYWTKPLDHLLAVGAVKLLHAAWGWPTKKVLALLSVLSGAGFVLLLYPTARRLASSAYGRFLVFCLPLTMGASQLWFGHIEHYSRVTALLLATMLASVRYLQTGRAAWAAPLLGAVTITAHPLSLCLVPGLCVLPLLGPEGVRKRLRVWTTAVIPALGYLAAFFVVSRHLGAGPVLLNPWKIRFVLYPRELTSIHLWNVFQNWLLTAPLGLAVIGADFLRTKRYWRDPVLAALFVFSASFFSFTLLYNHGLGRLRDWSLFAPSALPLCLLAAYGHVRRDERSRPAVLRGAFALALSTAFTVPWVASNHVHNKRPPIQIAGNESDHENIRRGVFMPTQKAFRSRQSDEQ